MSRVGYYSTLWVCTDCAMLIANGELPPELDEAEAADWLATIERNTPRGFHPVLGMPRAEHDEGCTGDGECSCERQSFSHSRCELCDGLPGAREACTLLEYGPLRHTIAYGDRVTIRNSRGEWTGTLVQRQRSTVADRPLTLYTVADGHSTQTGAYVRGTMLSWVDRAEALAKVDRSALVARDAPLAGKRWTKRPRATAVVEAWQ